MEKDCNSFHPTMKSDDEKLNTISILTNEIFSASKIPTTYLNQKKHTNIIQLHY